MTGPALDIENDTGDPRDAAAAYRRSLELEPDAADAEKIKARIAELER